jgi:hypothetical protein
MMAYRYNSNELELLFEQIKSDLKKKGQNQGGYLELEEKGDDFILKFKKEKSTEEKKNILKELEGSGLQHGSEVIDDALNIAYREGEEDREDLDIV